MKKFISIIIFVIFSSISLAETPADWKWEKVYNSIVLISSEKATEKIITEPVPKEFFEEFDENHNKFDEKGNKAAGARARKAIGEIKKIITEYRKASVAESKL